MNKYEANEIRSIIELTDIVNYVSFNGWNELKTHNNDIMIFQNRKAGRLYQIILPLKEELFDYNYMIDDSLKTLSAYYEKSVSDIVNEIENNDFDVIRLRIKDNDISAGRITIDTAIKAMSGIKTMIYETALLSFGNNKKKAEKYLSKCAFGQTEVGSYVITALCPIDDDYSEADKENIQLFDNTIYIDEYCGRKVTRKLVHDTDIIKNNIEKGNNDYLYNLEDISFKFYDGIEDVIGSIDNGDVYFSANWSNKKKDSSNEPFLEGEISFNSNYSKSINSVKMHVKSKTEETEKEEKSVEGYVYYLNSDAIPNLRETGKIRIKYIDENGKEKKMNIVVNSSDYEKAIEAHKEGKKVKAYYYQEGTENICSKLDTDVF